MVNINLDLATEKFLEKPLPQEGVFQVQYTHGP
jgi:hypothetical protein